MQRKNQKLIPFAITSKYDIPALNSFASATRTITKLPSIIEASYIFIPSSTFLDQQRIRKNEQALKESYSSLNLINIVGILASNLNSELNSAIQKQTYSSLSMSINKSPFQSFPSKAVQNFAIPDENSHKIFNNPKVITYSQEANETLGCCPPSICPQNYGSIVTTQANKSTVKEDVTSNKPLKQKEIVVDSLCKDPTCRNLLGGNAYKRRNVYKSVVRHMFSYIRKNRDKIVNLLQSLGYTKVEIEHAFFTVSCYNGEQNNAGNIENSQSIIKKIVSSISIFTYILRESLRTMVNKWDEGKLGKVAKTNLETYRYVATKLFEETKSITKSD